MAVDVYLKQDIRNILNAVYTGGPGTTALAEIVALSAQYGVPVERLLNLYDMAKEQYIGAVGAAFGTLEEQPIRAMLPLFAAERRTR